MRVDNVKVMSSSLTRTNLITNNYIHGWATGSIQAYFLQWASYLASNILQWSLLYLPVWLTSQLMYTTWYGVLPSIRYASLKMTCICYSVTNAVRKTQTLFGRSLPLLRKKPSILGRSLPICERNFQFAVRAVPQMHFWKSVPNVGFIFFWRVL